MYSSDGVQTDSIPLYGTSYLSTVQIYRTSYLRTVQLTEPNISLQNRFSLTWTTRRWLESVILVLAPCGLPGDMGRGRELEAGDMGRGRELEAGDMGRGLE